MLSCIRFYNQQENTSANFLHSNETQVAVVLRWQQQQTILHPNNNKRRTSISTT